MLYNTCAKQGEARGWVGVVSYDLWSFVVVIHCERHKRRRGCHGGWGGAGFSSDTLTFSVRLQFYFSVFGFL